MVDIVTININNIDKMDEEALEKIRTKFNNGFCILFTDYIYSLGYINKSDCEKIKDKYKSL